MLALTFFTSNSTKLAHARYLAEGRPVEVLGFRQRTYHAGYDEPRLQSRDDLLQASYESAVQQARKARILSPRHFFILEDTSVKIAALSPPGEEVPGLDVKYWMREITFGSLDAALRATGDNRKAVVRSDVVLHIPSHYRKLWGVGDYIVFTGEQSGSIVEREQTFNTNVMYPWLDNQTFNKWFQPDGASGPLGSLTIAEANEFDFRKKAFDQLFHFLQERKLLRSPVPQGRLPLQREMNYIICGYTCAGKTTASQYLARAYDYLHVEASDFMHLAYYMRHDVPEHISIGDFAERALIEKPEIAAEAIAKYLQADIESPCVISGFRSMLEIDWLVKNLGECGKQFRIVFTNAAEEIRFSRMVKRERSGDVNDIARFRSRDEQQKRMGLEVIAGSPSTNFWENEGELSTYLEVIKSDVGRAPLEEPDLDRWLSQVSQRRRLKLEEAILIALLTRWTDDEKRPCFTTSEIARIINELLSETSQKHKDNVSRYFNQNFYVYYEVELDPIKGTRRYRLSNTGYGKALSMLRRRAQTPEPAH
ncbi:non-canonical purine NTP pyrophosphatase [Agrobacterium salinitolerans]|uniref:AAA family ATPase n=1 Tax=Agrobacterium salinitolerans TaxID=1183413 RepID=A0A9X3KTC1_9HYPH|nr:non-canonical purine NTP pyrophosphatase [Agrobacterium salinitolerans]MCZ7940560.1 AAA family ATPase [Agrobacterium salinitolerans]